MAVIDNARVKQDRYWQNDNNDRTGLGQADQSSTQFTAATITLDDGKRVYDQPMDGKTLENTLRRLFSVLGFLLFFCLLIGLTVRLASIFDHQDLGTIVTLAIMIPLALAATYYETQLFELTFKSPLFTAVLARLGAPMLALFWAAEQENVDQIQHLINRGMDPDTRNDEGWTPLLWAAQHLSPSAIEVLLRAGADLEARDPFGRTALYNTLERLGLMRFLHARQGSKALLRLPNGSKAGLDVLEAAEVASEVLLRWGADIDIKDGNGKPLIKRLKQLEDEGSLDRLQAVKVQRARDETPPPP